MGSCVAGNQLHRAAGAVGSSLLEKLLCKGTDSSRPCTRAKQNPHLGLFTEGRQDHGKDTINMMEDTICKSREMKDIRWEWHVVDFEIQYLIATSYNLDLGERRSEKKVLKSPQPHPNAWNIICTQ